MNKYLYEFIGTFFLVLTIGCTAIFGGDGVIPPLAIGSALMVMIYAGGHLCGAHYNPAVTLGVFIRGKCPAGDVLPYIIAQLIGAVLAVFAAKYLFAAKVAEVALFTPVTGPAMLAEFLFTFALVYVILNVATSKATAGNSNYGLAIGFTVLVGAFSVGGISAGAFNPAVAVALCLFGKIPWSCIWLFLVAEFAAAVVAALAFKACNPEDK
jgi:aquaporin Z